MELSDAEVDPPVSASDFALSLPAVARQADSLLPPDLLWPNCRAALAIGDLAEGELRGNNPDGSVGDLAARPGAAS